MLAWMDEGGVLFDTILSINLSTLDCHIMRQPKTKARTGKVRDEGER